MTWEPGHPARTISGTIVWIHTIGERDAETLQLAEMLRGKGVDVHGPTAEGPEIQFDALAVVMSADVDSGPDDILEVEARFEPLA